MIGNTYTTVLPEHAREAAEGVAHLIRSARLDPAVITLLPPEPVSPQNDQAKQRTPGQEGSRSEPPVGDESTTCRLQEDQIAAQGVIPDAGESCLRTSAVVD